MRAVGRGTENQLARDRHPTGTQLARRGDHLCRVRVTSSRAQFPCQSGAGRHASRFPCQLRPPLNWGFAELALLAPCSNRQVFLQTPLLCVFHCTTQPPLGIFRNAHAPRNRVPVVPVDRADNYSNAQAVQPPTTAQLLAVQRLEKEAKE